MGISKSFNEMGDLVLVDGSLTIIIIITTYMPIFYLHNLYT